MTAAFLAIILLSIVLALFSKRGHLRQKAEDFFVASGQFSTVLFFFWQWAKPIASPRCWAFRAGSMPTAPVSSPGSWDTFFWFLWWVFFSFFCSGVCAVFL